MEQFMNCPHCGKQINIGALIGSVSTLLAVLEDKDRIDWLSANMGTISGRKLTREEIDDAMSSNNASEPRR